MELFFFNALEPATRFYFFSVVLVVVVSIVLHELAHGYMALRLGDPTPQVSGHMTLNPMVHMGPFSLVILMLVGIAWGAMPVDRTRLRGRYAESWVALVGPATNVVLMLIGILSVGLTLRFAGSQEEGTMLANAIELGWTLAVINALLAVFNMFPIPPLDGSHVLANLHQGYARLISDPSKQGMFFLSFAFVFVLIGPIMEGLRFLISNAILWISSVGL